ncbi:alpha/beta fold hydrolase [Demequina sp. NBRC 110053]|uniref:alpha/beta fold hydrolase n=1 Tax=Demequina sp. NBRC 110053 TaxID=1570342 RepID=UPI000A01F7E2|nr:alpha/beta hydrolase [Demequina sp. NBRC 110053]
MHDTTIPEPTLIAVNGIDLEVVEAGRENAGNPIVLCHGWPDLMLTWRRLVPELVAAGYHVIAPNQRGFGATTAPADVEAYDIEHLSGDLVGLLDHYGYEDAVFVGHDWGAFVVWSTAVLHPDRVKGVIAMAMPYLERGSTPWIEWMEAVLGPDYYFVHFNRQPGVADAVFDANPRQFLRNMYRADALPPEPSEGMALLDLARAAQVGGEPLLSEAELEAYASAFSRSGFTGGINWYRNLDRDWHLLAEADPIIRKPALMIYGDRDPIVRSERLPELVPGIEITSIDAGHWIHLEQPQETAATVLDWLARKG